MATRQRLRPVSSSYCADIYNQSSHFAAGHPGGARFSSCVAWRARQAPPIGVKMTIISSTRQERRRHGNRMPACLRPIRVDTLLHRRSWRSSQACPKPRPCPPKWRYHHAIIIMRDQADTSGMSAFDGALRLCDAHLGRASSRRLGISTSTA